MTTSDAKGHAVAAADRPAGPVRILRCRELTPGQAEAAIRRHERALAGEPIGRIAKRCGKSCVTLLDPAPETGGRALCVKEFIRGRWHRCLPARLRHRPAFHSWAMGLALAERGVAAPRPLAVAIGHPLRSFLVMSAEEGRGLAAYVRAEFGPACAEARRRAFVELGARCLLRCYEAGVVHDDLKASNILVHAQGPSGPWRFVLLDLAAIHLARRPKLEEALMNLAQLDASVPPEVSQWDRVRFLMRIARVFPEARERSSMERINAIARGRSRR